jgi:hypothetical protein
VLFAIGQAPRVSARDASLSGKISAISTQFNILARALARVLPWKRFSIRRAARALRARRLASVPLRPVL